MWPRSTRSRAWKLASLTFLAYEATAYASRGRVPPVTAIVRGLPRPLRVAATGVICAAIVDHLVTERIF